MCIISPQDMEHEEEHEEEHERRDTVEAAANDDRTDAMAAARASRGGGGHRRAAPRVSTTGVPLAVTSYRLRDPLLMCHVVSIGASARRA